MRVLYIGGIKSGKSLLAERKTLSLAQNKKPIYLATTEFIDAEMQERILRHKAQRQDRFETIEEPLFLSHAVEQTQAPILVECLSIWINNMLYHQKSYETMQSELEKLLQIENDIVFVLNDVGTGVIPDNALAREFVDMSGRLSQLVASECDEVYHVIAGIGVQIK